MSQKGWTKMEKNSKSGAGLVFLPRSLSFFVCVMGVSRSELKRNDLHKALKCR